MFTRLFMAALCLITGVDTATAQARADTRRLPVRVDLDPAATYTDSARIVRVRSDEGLTRIILPAASTTPRLLASAVLALAAVMEQEGDEVSRASVSMVGLLPFIPTQDERAAELVLSRLQRRRATAGPVAAPTSTTLWIPRAAERERIRLARRNGRPASPTTP